MSATAFSFEPLFLVLAVAAAVLYWRAARTDRPSTWRVVAFGSGLFLIAVSLNSPLETIAAQYLLLIHLLQNALIADVAPLLVLLGLTPRMREKVGRRRPRPDPRAVDPPALARRVVPDPPRRRSTTGRCAPAGG